MNNCQSHASSSRVGFECLLTDVYIEVHELQAKELPMLALGPNEKDAGGHRRYEMMGTPPALDPRAVYLQYGLAYGQSAVIPNKQKDEGQFQSSVSREDGEEVVEGN